VTARWPNLFIVGAQKAGTTSLWSYLGQHPEIRTASVKEPNFFSPSRRGVASAVKTESEYLRLFAGGGQTFRVDASTSYLFDPTSAQAIARACPEPRIVISLRDPVERAYSHYRFSVREGVERRPFLAAIEAEVGNNSTSRYSAPAYVRRGLYSVQVARYLELFGEGVHVLFFDDLVRDPARAVGEVFRFLELDSAFADRLDYTPRNVPAVPRNAVAARAFSSHSVIRVARALVPAQHRSRIERAFLRSVQDPPMERRARDLLTELYEPDSERLQTVLGRPLPWLTRRTG
jgi:hypothetical protein